MEHKCIQAKEIEDLKIKVAVAQSDINQVKSEIKEIKDTLGKFNWWFMGLLGTGIITLITVVYQK